MAQRRSSKLYNLEAVLH
jgi:pyruvate kinase